MPYRFKHGFLAGTPPSFYPAETLYDKLPDSVLKEAREMDLLEEVEAPKGQVIEGAVPDAFKRPALAGTPESIHDVRVREQGNLLPQTPVAGPSPMVPPTEAKPKK